MPLKGRLRKILKRRERFKQERQTSAPPSGPEVLPSALEVLETRESGVLVRTTTFNLEELHGAHALDGIQCVDGEMLGRLAGLEQRFDPYQAAFLDTETTGLGGGAGVYVFLTGLLLVDQKQVRATQVLLADLGAEEAYLDRVTSAMAGRTTLVSFFGKSFDRHRLDDRFAMHLRGRPFQEFPHCDLYHLARRLFGAGLDNTRLRTLEQAVLGVHRHDDLPGAECPQAYFDYLDGTGEEKMQRVLKHNLIDLLSLVTLAVRVAQVSSRPEEPHQAAAAGLMLLAAGLPDLALPRMEQALAGIRPDRFRQDRTVRRSALELAKLYRRKQATGQALALLELLESALPEDPEPLLLAAKLAEHDLKDRKLALRFAQRLRSRLKARSGSSADDQLAATHHRIARLERLQA